MQEWNIIKYKFSQPNANKCGQSSSQINELGHDLRVEANNMIF
jgi:hypothetical protein